MFVNAHQRILVKENVALFPLCAIVSLFPLCFFSFLLTRKRIENFIVGVKGGLMENPQQTLNNHVLW